MIEDSALNERATAVEIGGLVDGVGAPVMRAGYALKAKPSWITLSAIEGTGNSQVNVTAPLYKGRNGRSGLITVAGDGWVAVLCAASSLRDGLGRAAPGICGGGDLNAAVFQIPFRGQNRRGQKCRDQQQRRNSNDQFTHMVSS